LTLFVLGVKWFTHPLIRHLELFILKNPLHLIRWILISLLVFSGLVLFAGWFNNALSASLARAVARRASPNWPGYFQLAGAILVILAATIAAIHPLVRGCRQLLSGIHKTLYSSDRWLERRFTGMADLASPLNLHWPLDFNLPDWLAIILFFIFALLYQLSLSARGFPTIILGGDAANIASFAAGRAYPQLFINDAILGNLNNIGLYVTIHLPITIFLEKILGNFGLAYSVLLFPHVFMQYFSYYLLGRVLFHNRYWALLFTLAVSAPLSLAGGELWGVTGDGMPRFTYQVLIPFLMILMLTTWSERPQRWPWMMVAAGLLAFIHPVSTPAWAFALWLGFWPIMPIAYDMRRKLGEMIKLGLVLALALVPYITIYLTYKKGGQGSGDYDMVYYILTNYFPYDLLNIPGALITLFTATSQYGLLWYGLAGLFLTFILFRSERGRLGQMLTWMAGISFVTLLVPFVEQSIERSLRIIPIQTELMRGHRYLVPFLFIFWFYPLAQLTLRAQRKILTGTVFAVGTLSVVLWLGFNPPDPFIQARTSLDCLAQGRIICPTQTGYADALSYIREETPQNAQFVVFLTNRWSGIEVRYLGLRPMAYAYKDRGQLTFTNLEALKTWFYFLQRENQIYSRKISPTLDIAEERMLDFAKDAEANYMLTDFTFPPEVLKKMGVSIVYQNQGYSILQIYRMRP